MQQGFVFRRANIKPNVLKTISLFIFYQKNPCPVIYAMNIKANCFKFAGFMPGATGGRLVLRFGILKTRLAAAAGSSSVATGANDGAKKVFLSCFMQIRLLLLAASANCLPPGDRTDRPRLISGLPQAIVYLPTLI
ncbi:MAG: hypothetical protein R2791_15145 [Saprospiraceae bacterium]